MPKEKNLKKVKVAVLYSGGLDSAITIKLLEREGVAVIPLHIATPFRMISKKKIAQMLDVLGYKLRYVELGGEYIETIKKPKHARLGCGLLDQYENKSDLGIGLNNAYPCIDCKIFMLKAAWKYCRENGIDFIAMGDVFGQWPDQTMMTLIDNEAGVTGYVLRPLCAKLLEPTRPEIKKVVNRNHFFAFSGTDRQYQLKLARKLKIDAASLDPVSGGCLLTNPAFCRELNGTIEKRKKITQTTIEKTKSKLAATRELTCQNGVWR